MAPNAFNPRVSAETVRQVIERLEALPPSVEGDRDMLAWLRGERHGRVRLVDFDTSAANALHVTWEWKLKPPARKGNRTDVMFLVNGVLVTIVKHKNPTERDAIERGVTQLCRYEIETPDLVGPPQLFNVIHLMDYRYGITWNISRRFMARWSERPEESYRSAVQSFFEPATFLRRHNEIERLSRRLKGFRRHLPRFEKLYVIFLNFIMFVLIFNALR